MEYVKKTIKSLNDSICPLLEEKYKLEDRLSSINKKLQPLEIEREEYEKLLEMIEEDFKHVGSYNPAG